MQEILYQFHKANRVSGDKETLVELKNYSDKIERRYADLMRLWNCKS